MSQAGERSCLTLLERGVFEASAFLPPPHTEPEPLGHLRGTVISSSGSWWSGLEGFFLCP